MPTPVFSNPDFAAYVTQSFEFGRINQYLASAGDIFEASVSCKAVGLGPNSDLSRVQVGYFDPQVPDSSMALGLITPARALALPLPATPVTGRYQPQQTPGRILIWSGDRYDSTYDPSGAGPLVFERPIIDVVQYFADPPESIEGQRADKEYYYARMPAFGGDNSLFLLIPFYGRRYACCNFENAAGVDVAITISGLDFVITPASFPLTQLIAPFTLSDGSASQQIIRAATHGIHDYLQIQFNPTGDPGPGVFGSVRIQVSDLVA